MTAWGRSVNVSVVPDINSADPDLIYTLPDDSDWISSKKWCIGDQLPSWKPLQWAFGLNCVDCGAASEGCDKCSISLRFIRICKNAIEDLERITNADSEMNLDAIEMAIIILRRVVAESVVMKGIK